MWVAPTCSSPQLLNNFCYWCQGGDPQLAVGFPGVMCHPLRKASSPSLLLRATGRNQPVVAGKKCSMILLQAVVSRTFSLLQGVRLCCSEPRCSVLFQEVPVCAWKWGLGLQSHAKWAGGQTGSFLECWLKWESCFWSHGCPAKSTVCKGFT